MTTETHAHSHEDLFAAEADYWRKRSERAEMALRDLATAAQQARHSDLDLPPEPPIGTLLHDGESIVWTRVDSDGWVCANRACQNCPADWFEVVDQGGLAYGRKLP